MSFEGCYEYITKDGKYLVRDAYDEKYSLEKPYWQHMVDHTNGYEPDNPSTTYAPKVVISEVPIECNDYLGNTYFVKEFRYAPSSTEWRKIE